jgi:hypothetical protein
MSRSLVLLAFSCLMILTACKKGVDDPAFSLLSRKARMAGSWQLSSAHLKVNGTAAGKISTYEYDVKGSDLTLTVTTAGSSTVYVTQFSLTVNMSKDGSFDFNEKLGSSEIKASGRWSFNSGAGESKKKADVVYVLETVQEGATTDGFLFNRLNTNFEYFIRELRSKKLVLETSSFVYINANGDFQGMEGTFIFGQ